MLAPLGRVYAVEVDPEGVEICHENLRAHAMDNVRVIAGRAPEALAGLETPDAVFVGGSKGSMDEIVDVALERLRPGGRLVVNAITLENSPRLIAALRKPEVVPEVTLLQASRGANRWRATCVTRRSTRSRSSRPNKPAAGGKADMIYGTLYGVGVGPGAPDLMTLRAVETLKRADSTRTPQKLRLRRFDGVEDHRADHRQGARTRSACF